MIQLGLCLTLLALVPSMVLTEKLFAFDPELSSNIHQPQTTLKVGFPKKTKITQKGSLSDEDRGDDDYDDDISIDPDNISPSKVYAMDIELMQNSYSNIGLLMEVDMPDESSEEAAKNKRAFQTSIRLGGFYRFLFGEVFNISPFARLSSSLGVNLGSGYGGNSLKFDVSFGGVYYFSDFFGIEIGYGWGNEVIRFFGSLKSGKPSSTLRTSASEKQLTVGLKSTFW